MPLGSAEGSSSSSGCEEESFSGKTGFSISGISTSQLPKVNIAPHNRSVYNNIFSCVYLFLIRLNFTLIVIFLWDLGQCHIPLYTYPDFHNRSREVEYYPKYADSPFAESRLVVKAVCFLGLT